MIVRLLQITSVKFERPRRRVHQQGNGEWRSSKVWMTTKIFGENISPTEWTWRKAMRIRKLRRRLFEIDLVCSFNLSLQSVQLTSSELFANKYSGSKSEIKIN